MKEKVQAILLEMADYLKPAEMKRLQEALLRHLSENDEKREQTDNHNCRTISSSVQTIIRRYL